MSGGKTGPRVSIGVPIYNGASMLAESLDGLSAQSHNNLEILISDNCSTDATPQIVADYLHREPRASATRQVENLGALGNFRFLLWQATAPYFLWRSYDDLFDDRYVAQLLAVLEAQPGAALAAPHVETMRLATGKRRPRPVTGLQGRGPREVLRRSQAGWIYGLWRTEDLRRAFDWAVGAIHPHVWGWDHLALFPAILGGRVAFENDARLTLRLNNAIPKEQTPDAKSRAVDLATRYRDACFAEIDAKGLRGFARWHMRRAVHHHIHKRISSRWKRL